MGPTVGTRAARRRAQKLTRKYRLTCTDLFCGAGGATSGMINARYMGLPICDVEQAVNHDEVAIASHSANHSRTRHFIEDITTLDVMRLIRTAVLWASLECTNFSNAKGGMPRDADSRSLPEHMPRYIRAIRPLYFIVENVAEFMAWGPLDANGKPVSRKKGVDYLRWVDSICQLGYRYEHREMNAADHGADTSRKRYFAIFAREDAPIRFPAATHSKGGKTPGTKPWRAVRALLDLTDKGASIFKRKKALSEKTLARIYAGLCKYVAGKAEAFITKYLSNSANGKPNAGLALENPAPTITCQDRLAVCSVSWVDNPAWFGHGTSTAAPSPVIVARQDKAPLGVASVEFMVPQFGSATAASIEAPAGTITTSPKPRLASAAFIAKYYGSGDNVQPLSVPAGTITTKDRLALVSVQWFDKRYGSGAHNHQPLSQPAGALLTNDHHVLMTSEFLTKAFTGAPGTMAQGTDRPAGSITTVDHHQLVQLAFFDKMYGSGAANIQSLDQPAGTITTNDHHQLVTVQGWMLDNKFANVGRALSDPGPTLLTGDHHYVVQPLLMPTSFDRSCLPTTVPCPTLVASRRHTYVVQFEACAEQMLENWIELETDSPTMCLIRRFCRVYGIADVFLRLLKVAELLRIQGFPSDYVLKGTQTDQKKFIGNSVVPLMAQRIVEELYAALADAKLLHLLEEFQVVNHGGEAVLA